MPTPNPMKTNITLKLDAELLKEARTLAAREGCSLSGLLAAKLEEIVQERKGYVRAQRRALERLRKCSDFSWERPDSRGELREQ